MCASQNHPVPFVSDHDNSELENFQQSKQQPGDAGTGHPGIVLLGLGPGDVGLLTRQAWAILQDCEELYVRTLRHPLIPQLPAHIRLVSFDELYEKADTFEQVYSQIVDRVLQAGQRPGGVIYAVPGHPFIAEATGPEIARRAKQAGLDLHVVEGLSFLEPTFSALGLDPFPHTALVDALELAVKHVPPFPPNMPAIVAQIYSKAVASDVKLSLMALYPDEHPVKLVHAAGTLRLARVEELPLHQIDHSRDLDLMTTLYVPPLAHETSFEAFLEVVAHLRAPDGCPWDREQTHQSLRADLLEEAYETLAAIDSDDPDAMREEFGDLLLLILMHAQIAAEYGEFTIADVLQGIHVKIVHRHPHVFGDLKLGDAQGVLLTWERLKAEERAANGKSDSSLLDGVNHAFPALLQATQYQRRAARVGFDWPEVEGVWEKVHEELQEVRDAVDAPAREAEIGDLLFAMVNLARWYGVDAESALRQANSRFRERFMKIEQAARVRGRALGEMSIEELEALWQAAKNDSG